MTKRRSLKQSTFSTTKKVMISGASGRMGTVVGKILDSHKSLVRTKNSDKTSDNKADVCIDFSAPGAAMDALEHCVRSKIPFVSGTTGLSDAQMKKLIEAAKKIPVLWSPNMSLGVNLMRKAMRDLAGGLEGYDLHIEEIHHKNKKDAPSGTALYLKDALKKAPNFKNLEITSVRGGGVFGEHRVFCISDGEKLTFEHVALNRDIFAQGAVAAAEWILKMPAGLYSMEDLFEKKS